MLDRDIKANATKQATTKSEQFAFILDPSKFDLGSLG
jgi:hypothetical protein